LETEPPSVQAGGGFSWAMQSLAVFTAY
jgi:hypothetical protein